MRDAHKTSWQPRNAQDWRRHRAQFPSEVHVWHAELATQDWPSIDRLPSDERDRAEKLPPKKVKRWVASRWALRLILGHYLDEKPTEVGLRTTEHGKPELVCKTSLRFNLSHSRDLALIAVTHGREVGIDVEWIDPRRDILKLAPRALKPSVAAAVLAVSPHAQAAALHTAWTHREAVAKCLGSGLTQPLPSKPVTITTLQSLRDGYVGTVAIAPAAIPTLRHFQAGPANLQYSS